MDEVDRCASEERDFVRQFDGDCFSPIAAHCYIKNNKSTLIGYVSSTDGNRFIKTKIVENVNEMRGIGKKLAKIMIKQGAKKSSRQNESNNNIGLDTNPTKRFSD